METTKLHITINDYHKIIGLIDMGISKDTLVETTGQLLSNLKNAKMISQVKIPRFIVTMNSELLLKDINSGRSTAIKITYPHEANPAKGSVSIFSPIGVALLGRQEGDIVSWQIPDGVGYFKIEQVLYQPEAAGHFHL